MLLNNSEVKFCFYFCGSFNFVLKQASYGSLVGSNLSSNSTLTCDSGCYKSYQKIQIVVMRQVFQKYHFSAQQRQVVGKPLLLLSLYKQT